MIHLTARIPVHYKRYTIQRYYTHRKRSNLWRAFWYSGIIFLNNRVKYMPAKYIIIFSTRACLFSLGKMKAVCFYIILYENKLKGQPVGFFMTQLWFHGSLFTFQHFLCNLFRLLYGHASIHRVDLLNETTIDVIHQYTRAEQL